ncbi:MAG TPA: TadE/TadG family type IV pilus assembly protein [Lacipirellula sp.]
MSTRILKRIPCGSLKTPRKQRPRRGVAAVEFAIVAPVFFLLIIGIVEIGRAMMVQQVLINASRVGARRAITLSSTEQAVIDAVEEYAAGVGVDGVTVAVSPNPATAAAGASITVDVEIGYNQVSWLPAPWFMGGKQLAATSVMRKEGF